jgi:hypothetical protein
MSTQGSRAGVSLRLRVRTGRGRRTRGPRGVPCRLQKRSFGRADVMVCEPVRGRHQQPPRYGARQYDNGDPGCRQYDSSRESQQRSSPAQGFPRGPQPRGQSLVPPHRHKPTLGRVAFAATRNRTLTYARVSSRATVPRTHSVREDDPGLPDGPRFRRATDHPNYPDSSPTAQRLAT